MREKSPAVYILANVTQRVLYIGVTSNLVKRVYEHKNKIDPDSFTSKYNVKQLVYYSLIDTMIDAISLERKLRLVLEK